MAFFKADPAEQRRQIEQEVRAELKAETEAIAAVAAAEAGGGDTGADDEVVEVKAKAKPPKGLKISRRIKTQKIPEENKDETKVCKICYDALIGTAVIDCGHSYMCPDCARLEPKECAICKKKIKQGITAVFSA